MKEKYRLVHLISSLKIGGAESLLVDLLRALPNDRFEHHVIYFHAGPNIERVKDLGIETHQIKGLISLYDPLFFFRLFSCLKHLRPDCIHAGLWAANFSGRIIAKLLRIPIVCVVHLGVDQDGNIRNLLDRFTFRLADRIVAVSDVVASSITKKRSWISAQKINVIKNGIDSTYVREQCIRAGKTRADFDLNDQHFVIGSVGRLIARKNFSLLIEAITKLVLSYPFIRLMIVGFGPQEQQLREKAQALTIADKIFFIKSSSVYAYLPLFDCFVQPSWQEGLSIALLEAMCFELPCIVTGKQGQHDVIISGKNGLIVQPGKVEALVRALEKMVNDSALRKKLGTQGYRTLLEIYSIDRMSKEYQAHFEQLV